MLFTSLNRTLISSKKEHQRLFRNFELLLSLDLNRKFSIKLNIVFISSSKVYGFINVF